jgi:hypothetical protein
MSNAIHSLPIRISSPRAEGILQVSKWIKVQVLLDGSEMRQLIHTLGPLFCIVVSEAVKGDEALISLSAFLEKYEEYVSLLKQGQVPQSDAFRRFFSCALSTSLDICYAIVVGDNKFLIKPTRPILQLQTHHFFYSDLNGKFHPMVLSPESISWGLQISYPLLFQDPVTGQVAKVIDSPAFPNTAIFTQLRRWIRSFTLPTPFEVNAMRIHSTIRIGKQALVWIKNHLQLKQKGIQVVYSNKVGYLGIK